MIAFLFTLLSFAHAADTASITVEGETTEFLLIASGTRLDFSTPGPKKITVDSRRRMAGAAQRARVAPLSVEGDGNLILTIRVPGTAIAEGTINDRLGGFPSKSDRSVVTVPEGGKVLSLEAPVGGPDFFVRVVDRTWPDRLIVPIRVSQAGVDSMPDPEIIEESTDPAAAELEKEDDSAYSGEAESKRESRNPSAPDILKPGAGVSVGLGVPARGTRLMISASAIGRYPVYKDLISAGALLGWYRIGVEQQVPIADPIAGDLTYAANWHTTVIPIVAQANIHVPFPAGPITPIAGIGPGLYVATRVDGTDRRTKAAVGPAVSLGTEIASQIGEFQLLFNWHDARARFGNQAEDGSVVRETLSVAQFNLAYLYLF